MFSLTAKIVESFFILPAGLILVSLLAVLGLWTRWFRAFRLVASFGVLALAVCLFLPVSAVLLRPLEDRFPMPVLTTPPTGIIVLGGSTDEAISGARDQVILESAAERLTQAVVLSRRFPTARLVFSGGSGRLEKASLTESDVARRLWTELGVAPERMTFEDRSRDTWENANFTKALIQPKPGETWLLVTSASHMPRAVGIFRRIDFPVVPYPVDYRTAGTSGDFIGFRRVADSARDLAVASHEWLGLLAYYLTGKSSALLPSP
jgi:uncharacterized SAM-binding protein YcdF (DUF218 family)